MKSLSLPSLPPPPPRVFTQTLCSNHIGLLLVPQTLLGFSTQCYCFSPPHPILLTSLPFLNKCYPLFRLQPMSCLFPEVPMTPHFRDCFFLWTPESSCPHSVLTAQMRFLIVDTHSVFLTILLMNLASLYSHHLAPHKRHAQMAMCDHHTESSVSPTPSSYTPLPRPAGQTSSHLTASGPSHPCNAHCFCSVSGPPLRLYPSPFTQVMTPGFSPF